MIDSDSIERRAIEARHAGASFVPSVSPQEIIELVQLLGEAQAQRDAAFNEGIEAAAQEADNWQDLPGAFISAHLQAMKR